MLRKRIRLLHLWIGLPIGFLFFLIAFSGAIYTWHPEFAKWSYQQRAEVKDAEFVSISTLKDSLKTAFPKGDFRTAMYRGHGYNMEVLLYGMGTYFHAQMDPYSGTLVHLQDMNKGWLHKVLTLHRNLWLGDVGKEIGHWVTLLFLCMMVSGLFLWWPRNAANRRMYFRINWSGSLKRRLFDLHSVVGFYVSWVAIFSVMTGLFWGFDCVKDGLKTALGENDQHYEKPVSDTTSFVRKDQNIVLDSLFRLCVNQFPDRFVRISNPHEVTEAIRVALVSPRHLLYKTDLRFFDRYTGEELTGHFASGLAKDASPYHTVHFLVHDIHFGQILGLPGRLLVFFSSLFAASLPITGFLMWWRRRRR